MESKEKKGLEYSKFISYSMDLFPDELINKTHFDTYFMEFIEVENGRPVYMGHDSLEQMRHNIRCNIHESILRNIKKCHDDNKKLILVDLILCMDNAKTSTDFIEIIDTCNKVIYSK